MDSGCDEPVEALPMEALSMGALPIRVLIVEDYALIRLGLKAELERHEGLCVVGEAATAAEGLAQAKALTPDVVLMDLGLPDFSGVEATRKLKETHPCLKIVILTSHDTEADVMAALNAGAHAYCLKDIAGEQLSQVVLSVARGAAWLDPAVAPMALQWFQNQTPKYEQAPTDGLLKASISRRELEVLKLLVAGHSNTEIATRLAISAHTAKAHVGNILQKLSVQDRVQAAVKAIQAGLV